MPDDKVTAAVTAAMGKKSKYVKLKLAPEGTSAKKLPKDVMKALSTQFSPSRLKEIKVHTGGNALEICKSLKKAKAFAIGTDIYIGKPSDAKNSVFLAHELAHVVQQGNGRMPKEKKEMAVIMM